MSNLLASCCLSGLMFPLVAFFLFLPNTQKRAFVPFAPSPSSEMKCLQDRYLGSLMLSWPFPVVIALLYQDFFQDLYTKHDYSPSRCSFNSSLGLLWPFLFFILFLWTYPLGLCLVSTYGRECRFIYSCRLNFFDCK